MIIPIESPISLSVVKKAPNTIPPFIYTMRATPVLLSKFQPAISLHGRHCLVTGGSGALGSSIAADMARAGARVTLLGRDESKLRATLSEVQSVPPEQGAVEQNSHRYLVVGEGNEVKDAIAVCLAAVRNPSVV